MDYTIRISPTTLGRIEIFCGLVTADFLDCIIEATPDSSDSAVTMIQLTINHLA